MIYSITDLEMQPKETLEWVNYRHPGESRPVFGKRWNELLKTLTNLFATIQYVNTTVASVDLQTTLAVGNTTGANDIVVTEGRVISFDNATFLGDIAPITLTANRAYALQDASGTIAFLSDIPAANNIYSNNGTVGAGRVATLTDYIAFNGGEFRTQNGYWQGTAKILYINPNGTTANLFVGESSGNGTMTGSTNVVVGYQSFYTNTVGSSNVALGAYAGYYETGSNKLFIDNAQRANEADGRTKALVYGIFDAAVANQRLYINANEGKFGQINIGSDTNLNSILWNSNSIPTVLTGTRNTFIGNNDTGVINLTTGVNNTIIGSFTSNSLTTGSSNLLMGTYATIGLTTGSTNMWFGNCSTTNSGIVQSIAFNAKPTNNSEVIFGDPDIARYNQFFIGQGKNTPDSYGKFDVDFSVTSNQSGETDKNATVSNFYINGSKGTGTGVGGNVVIRTAPFGATGSTQNTLINAFSVLGSGDIDTPLAHYNYMAASNSADTVGDVRFYATYVATVSSFIIEKCTVANAAKGGGTWVNINTFSL